MVVNGQMHLARQGWRVARVVGAANAKLGAETVRLPYPERIPIWGAIIFAIVLCSMELLQGTSRVFTLCVFLYIVLTAVTINIGGGLTRPSGAYTLFVAVGTCILGLTVKAVVWEAADSNLQTPEKTIAVYLAGMASLCVAVYLTRRLVPRKAWLEGVLTDDNMSLAAKGCLAAGIGLPFLTALIGTESVSVGSAIGQLNHFVAVSIILGVAYQIRKSGGKSSINTTVVIASAFLFFFGGIIGAGKQGFFTPIFSWLLTCAALRYNFKRSQLIMVVVALGLMFYYLFPYAQYARGFGSGEDETFSARFDRSIHLFMNPAEVRAAYEGGQVEYQSTRDTRAPQYFANDLGLFERLQMISMDDALIQQTDEHGSIGYLPLVYDFYNLVPHFIWADKPQTIIGNHYAHELDLGVLADEDLTTGISFGPLAEAYHLGMWFGVLLVAPLLWLMMFLVHESTTGSINQTIWSLFLLVEYAHGGVEAMFGFVIYFTGYGTLVLFITAYATAYLMPIFGSLIGGPEKRLIRRVGATRSVAKRTGEV